MADRGADVNPFSYTAETLEEIEGALSHELLHPYLDAVGGDRESALRLYLWNTAASAAFYGPLQGLEVALRNALHRKLAVMDSTALVLCRDNGVPIRVFNMFDNGALLRLIAGEPVGTLVHAEAAHA